MILSTQRALFFFSKSLIFGHAESDKFSESLHLGMPIARICGIVVPLWYKIQERLVSAQLKSEIS
jgi:hypothetical protein